MKKHNDVVFVNEDGVKVTLCAPRKPRKGERTYDPARGKYSQWAQGVSRMTRGVGGVQGTMG
jgi:hypothetical protein